MPYKKVNVACYSGYKANERPVAFDFENRRWEISEIIDRWYEGGLDPGRPALNYFKVRTADGPVFLIRYNPLFDAWAIKIPS